MAKPIVEAGFALFAIARVDQAGKRHHIKIDRFLARQLRELFPRIRRIANAKDFQRFIIEAAFVHIFARRPPQAIEKHLLKKFCGQLVDEIQRVLFLRHGCIFGIGFGNRNAGAFRQQAHGFGETDILLALNEGKNIPTGAAAETMKKLFIGVDVKGRRFLGVKRAQAEKVSSAFFERDIIRHHGHDVRSEADFVD